jgi:hypothetical protein
LSSAKIAENLIGGAVAGANATSATNELASEALVAEIESSS